jgi:hypothetical protein
MLMREEEKDGCYMKKRAHLKVKRLQYHTQRVTSKRTNRIDNELLYASYYKQFVLEFVLDWYGRGRVMDMIRTSQVVRAVCDGVEVWGQGGVDWG